MNKHTKTAAFAVAALAMIVGILVSSCSEPEPPENVTTSEATVTSTEASTEEPTTTQVFVEYPADYPKGYEPVVRAVRELYAMGWQGELSTGVTQADAPLNDREIGFAPEEKEPEDDRNIHATFVFHDLNGDGSPELILHIYDPFNNYHATNWGQSTLIWTIRKNKLHFCGERGTELLFYNSNTLMSNYCGMGWNLDDYYRIIDGKLVAVAYSEDNSGGIGIGETWIHYYSGGDYDGLDLGAEYEHLRISEKKFKAIIGEAEELPYTWRAAEN